MGIIPLSDASRRPARFPFVTALIIVVNVLAFLLELASGDAFVIRWAVIPADIVAGEKVGLRVGQAAWALAKRYFAGTAKR